MPTLEVATAQALAAVRRYCGWHIGPVQAEDVVVTVDGSGAQYLQLPTLRIVSITEVKNDDVVLDLATDVQWSENGYLWRAAGWSRNYRGVEVTLKHGYDTFPDDVQGVVDRIAERIVGDAGTVQQVGQVRYATSLAAGASLGGALSSYELELLAAYRLPPLP